jgi:hypothetical protein
MGYVHFRQPAFLVAECEEFYKWMQAIEDEQRMMLAGWLDSFDATSE